MSNTAHTYDSQAAVFESRAGLGKHNSQIIASAISKLVETFQQPHLLELGCGSGELGSMLADSFHSYLGIDISLAMLNQFRQKHGLVQSSLIQSDANGPWPIGDNSIDVVFSSRALHWIDITHTINELYRVARNQQSLLIVGRMEMHPDSWEPKLRQQCHALIQQQGLVPRKGEEHIRTLQNQLLQNNAVVLEPVTVCNWRQQRTPLQAIEDWQAKRGLAGIALSVSSKAGILKELRNWIESNFGNTMPTECIRKYIIYPIRLYPN